MAYVLEWELHDAENVDMVSMYWYDEVDTSILSVCKLYDCILGVDIYVVKRARKQGKPVELYTTVQRNQQEFSYKIGIAINHKLLTLCDTRNDYF
jgi:UDP-glucose 4-epimerase